MSKEFNDYLKASNELNALVRDKRLPIAIEGEGYSISTVTYKKIPPLTSLVVSSREPITPMEIPAWNPRLWTLLESGMATAGLKPRHPCIYFYSQGQGKEVSFVLQIGFPFPELPATLPADLLAHRDEERWCASVVLIGPFIPNIGHAWNAVLEQVSRSGLQKSGEDREIYHHMTDFICTEIQIGLVDTPDMEERIEALAQTPGSRPAAEAP